MTIIVMVSLICDCCELEILGEAYDEDGAQKLADKKGWATFQDGSIHYCPNCKEQGTAKEIDR